MVQLYITNIEPIIEITYLSCGLCVLIKSKRPFFDIALRKLRRKCTTEDEKKGPGSANIPRAQS